MRVKEKRVRKLLNRYHLTEFETEVLIATALIEEGRTITYKELAARIGRPYSYRAVGNALGKNPLAPVIPCHRVIKSNGELGGYSGNGGTRRKKNLLRSEKAI